MNQIAQNDLVAGGEGRAYAKINGNNEELLFARKIEARAEKTKSEVRGIGRRTTGHKATGLSMSGTMTIYYVTSLFRQLMAQYKDTGKDVYFDMVVENEDPASATGKQTVLLSQCNLDSVIVASLDDEAGPLEEDVEFTFEDYTILTPFTKI